MSAELKMSLLNLLSNSELRNFKRQAANQPPAATKETVSICMYCSPVGQEIPI